MIKYLYLISKLIFHELIFMQDKLDDKDRMIMTLLQRDPEISQDKISEKLGITQPSISARLRKLKKNGFLLINSGINLRKVNLYIGKVDLYAKSESTKILETFSKCPYCINAFPTSGRHNIFFLFACEDLNTLEAIVDHRLRPIPEITHIDFSIALAPAKDLIVPIIPRLDKTNQCPCGSSCKDCDVYAANRCLGCPATDMYKGNLWKAPKIV